MLEQYKYTSTQQRLSLIAGKEALGYVLRHDDYDAGKTNAGTLTFETEYTPQSIEYPQSVIDVMQQEIATLKADNQKNKADISALKAESVVK